MNPSMNVIKKSDLRWHSGLRISLSMLTILAVLLSCENAGSARIPQVETENITGVTSTSAISGGRIILDGGTAISMKGVCWSTDANPTKEDSHTEDGTGTENFISTITGLNPDSEYHVRAYAVNQVPD